MAGVVSHPMDNVLWKVGLLCDGDPDAQFGLSGVDVMSEEAVLALIGDASGFEPDPYVRWGPVRVRPEPILAECRRMGDRLALAVERGERVVLATGHPTGLISCTPRSGGCARRLGARSSARPTAPGGRSRTAARSITRSATSTTSPC